VFLAIFDLVFSRAANSCVVVNMKSNSS